MILSTKHQFIFLKTSKTAGTSLEIALSRYLGPDDVITPIAEDDEKLRSSLGYRGPQNHLHDDKPVIGATGGKASRVKYYNHIPAAELLGLVGAPLFSGFLKVSVVRNPFDMAVSRFFWDYRNQQNLTQKHFRGWLLSRPPILLKNRGITHIQNRCVADLMLRFEAFESGIAEFSRRVGLPDTVYNEFRSIRAKSQYRPGRASAKAMFDGFDEGKQVIEEMFEEDIRLYGYSLS
jgi:hypothetical protein